MHHARHFARLFVLLALAGAVFVNVRARVVPKDFGTQGHFRASAIAEAAAREPRHLGSDACTDCHAKISEAWATGKHHTPQCENCHGPGLIHVAIVSEDSVDKYPDAIKHNPNGLRVTSGIQECKWCHLAAFERPRTLKFIRNVEQHILEHKGKFTPQSRCIDCHDPHTTLVS